MRSRALWASIAVLATLLGGCSLSGAASTPAVAHMAVTLADYKLTTSTVEVPAGPVTFDVLNNGPSTHEFIVDRTTLDAGNLPLDGMSVVEDSPLLHRE